MVLPTLSGGNAGSRAPAKPATRPTTKATVRRSSAKKPVKSSGTGHYAPAAPLAIHVTPKPILPGHEAGPKTGPSVTPPTARQQGGTSGSGRWGAPVDKTPAAPKPKPKPTTPPVKAKPKPTPKPKPTTTPPTQTKPAPSTNSPAPTPPGPTSSSGGFLSDLGSLLPMLLIAGAVIAGLYLYTHRKGR